MRKRGRGLRTSEFVCTDYRDALRVETQTQDAPHNAVKLELLSVFVGAKCLLADASLKIAEQCRVVDIDTPRGSTRQLKAGTCYGLIGLNGCGKSTLLRLVSDGRLPVPVGWDTFLVSQALPAMASFSAQDEVKSVDTDLKDLLNQQNALKDKLDSLAVGSETEFALVYSDLQDVQNKLVAWDGFLENVENILIALGFDRQDADNAEQCGPSMFTPVDELSGGWRMKVQLAKALCQQPKLLLLDEPTNHLDFQALRWLQDQLQRYPYTVVVVSHDVDFLHTVCHQILWMHKQQIEVLPRNMVSQDDLARMQRRRDLRMAFSVPEAPPGPLNHGCSFHDIRFRYSNDDGDEASGHGISWQLTVSHDIRLSNKSRCVLLGPNGSGKSTFLKLCAGKLAPTEGSIDHDSSLIVAHFSQHMDELDCDSDIPAAQYIGQQCPEALQARLGPRSTGTRSKAKQAVEYERLLGAARAVLSRFGFEGELADGIKICDLSGGQKTLLKLALLSLHPAHILCLDEPTNHLDAHACEVLVNALNEFEGGIVAATHDDIFIYRLIEYNWLVSELLVCQNGHVRREADFGAHCISALKEEIRRSEASAQKLGSKFDVANQ